MARGFERGSSEGRTGAKEVPRSMAEDVRERTMEKLGRRNDDERYRNTI